MKLIVDLLSTNVEEYNVDGVVIASSDYSTFPTKSFKDEEIISIVKYCKENNILTILSIDKIIHEFELKKLKVDLEFYLNLGIDYFVYSDFSILIFFLNIGKANKLIYDPKTLITNSKEAAIHKDYGSLVAISNELTFDEILKISKVGNAIFEIYGHHQIFYSKRNLLSNYKDFSSIDGKLIDEKLYIREERRDGSYPVYESNNGYFVYTDYRYYLFEEFMKLKDTLVMAKISSNFIEEDELFEIIEVYNKLFKLFEESEYDNEEVNALKESLVRIYDNLSTGHLYKASVLLGGNKK